MALEFEHKGKGYRLSDDHVKVAAMAGVSEEELIAIHRRGIDEWAKIDAREAKREANSKTKQVSIDKDLHDRLKVVAAQLGLTPFHALEMLVEQFVTRAMATLAAHAP